jgi:riboflavin biosynthesis pyrimidine reductase
MPPQNHADGRAGRARALVLRRLLPPGEPVAPAALVEELGLWRRPQAAGGRPRVLLNMVSTADGRATLGERSGPISGAGDRELFHALRTAVDGVIAGAGTVRTERYGRLIHDPGDRRLRVERGLSEEPLACVVSGRVALAADIPLLDEPEAHVVVVTGSEGTVSGAQADVQYVRSGRAGRLDLSAALGELRERFGIDLLLCEGGPHLALQLLSERLVDEVFLTVAPLLAGGELSERAALRITAGAELEPPQALELRGALEHDSYLFLRYGVRLP